MIHPSFIPPRPLRELRDLTRRRERLNGAGSAEKNRVQKVLEDANVKLGNVLTDVFGVSGQLMLDALLKGEAKPEEIAQFARKRAKKKIPEIIAALERQQMSEHHRKMIRYSLSHMKFIEEQIEEIDRDIAAKIQEARPGSTMADLADRAGSAATQRREDPRRDRSGHDAIPVAAEPQFLGGHLPRKQSERWEESKKPPDRR